MEERLLNLTDSMWELLDNVHDGYISDEEALETLKKLADELATIEIPM